MNEAIHVGGQPAQSLCLPLPPAPRKLGSEAASTSCLIHLWLTGWEVQTYNVC